ncbi:hypothetical protein V2J09_002008 [Rumex salicifolius]
MICLIQEIISYLMVNRVQPGLYHSGPGGEILLFTCVHVTLVHRLFPAVYMKGKPSRFRGTKP